MISPLWLCDVIADGGVEGPGGPAQYKVEVRAAGGTGLSHRDGSQSQSCYPVTGSPQCVCVCKEGRWDGGGGGGRGGIPHGSKQEADVRRRWQPIPMRLSAAPIRASVPTCSRGWVRKKKKKGLSHHVSGGGGVGRGGRLVSSAARPRVPCSQSHSFSHFKRRHAQPGKRGNGNERQTDDGRVQRL